MDSHLGYRNLENLKFHPYNILLILIITAISALFIGLIIAYVYTLVFLQIEAIVVPKMFYLTSIVLLLSSYSIHLAYKAYQRDQTQLHLRSLWIAFTLTMMFLTGQLLGWQELILQNKTFKSSNGTAYLYLLSGVHFVHVIGGIPFLLNQILLSHRKLKDPVTSLVYFADPAQKLKLKMIKTYWYFLDYLWIFLVVVLILSSFCI